MKQCMDCGNEIKEFFSLRKLDGQCPDCSYMYDVDRLFFYLKLSLLFVLIFAALCIIFNKITF